MTETDNNRIRIAIDAVKKVLSPAACPGYESSDGDDSNDSSIYGYPNPEEDIPSESQIIYDIAHSARHGRDLEEQVRYVNHRIRLQGKEVAVPYKKNGTVVKWTVSDLEQNLVQVLEKKDPQTVGLTGFDFRRQELSDASRRPNRRINFLKLFFSLWPGNIHHQLLLVNSRIEADNKEKTRGRGKVLPISLREFCHFLAVMMIARLEGKQGSDLWQGAQNDDEGYRSPIDVSRYMTKYRHTQIRRYFSYFFADERKKSTDPWWPVIGGINAFNHNRNSLFNSSNVRIMDESMSAFRPRTTPKGK